MPTNKPRINVTVQPHQHELLSRLASLRGVSMSQVMRELLEGVEPVLLRVAVVLQAAAKAEREAKDGLRKTAEDFEADIQPLLETITSQFDMFVTDFASNDGAERGAGDETCRAPSRAGFDVSTPGTVTTGVRFSPNTQKDEGQP